MNIVNNTSIGTFAHQEISNMLFMTCSKDYEQLVIQIVIYDDLMCAC